MMKKSNENGSTIVMGIVIVMIIFVILGTALAIALNYQQRSINEHARKQAYLNGISVVDAIAGQFNGDNANTYLPTKENPVVINEVSLPATNENGANISHTGQISARIIMDNTDDNIVYIQVTSIYNKQKEEVQLTMQKYNNEWYRKVYSEIGETFSHENE